MFYFSFLRKKKGHRVTFIILNKNNTNVPSLSARKQFRVELKESNLALPVQIDPLGSTGAICIQGGRKRLQNVICDKHLCFINKGNITLCIFLFNLGIYLLAMS